MDLSLRYIHWTTPPCQEHSLTKLIPFAVLCNGLSGAVYIRASMHGCLISEGLLGKGGGGNGLLGIVSKCTER